MPILLVARLAHWGELAGVALDGAAAALVLVLVLVWLFELFSRSRFADVSP